jgi:hypothetical protein
MRKTIVPLGTACRAVLSLVLTLGIAAVAAGCVTQHAVASHLAGTFRTERIDPAKATALSVPGGAAVTLPAGAVRGRGTVSVRQIAPPKPAPSGMLLLGHTWEIEVSGSKLTGSAIVRLPAPPVPGTSGESQPDVVLVAYFDTATQAWTPVPAAYDAATRTAVVSTPHLSIWSVISVDLKALAAKAANGLADLFGVNSTAAQPSCPGAATAATAGVRAASSGGSLIKWCVGEEAGQAVLRVADDRSFAVEVDYPGAWSLSRDGWPDIDTAIADGIGSALAIAPNGDKKVIVGGGDTVTFHIPAGASGTASAIPSSPAYLASALLYGLNTLVMTTESTPFAKAPTPSALVNAIQLVFTVRDCVSSFQALAGSPVTSASGAVSLFWQVLKLAGGCLGDEWEVAYGKGGFLTSYVVGVVMWLLDGLRLVGGGLYAAVEDGVYWQGYNMRVAVPAPLPTLGLLWSSNQKGYGQARPSTVFNGGDPTGLVTGISWSSWGGATAIGTGTAEWVGPNQYVATGTEETATIVAFDLGTCGGRPAYQAVEWYFPQHGQKFDPASYIQDCTGQYVGNG